MGEKKKRVKAFYLDKKYEGILEDTTDTHFIIFDFILKSNVHLPKIQTRLEELNKAGKDGISK